MERKVFCGFCKHCRLNKGDDCRCMAPDNLVDTFFAPKWGSKENVLERNEDNNCRYFEEGKPLPYPINPKED